MACSAKYPDFDLGCSKPKNLNQINKILIDRATNLLYVQDKESPGFVLFAELISLESLPSLYRNETIIKFRLVSDNKYLNGAENTITVRPGIDIDFLYFDKSKTLKTLKKMTPHTLDTANKLNDAIRSNERVLEHLNRNKEEPNKLEVLVNFLTHCNNLHASIDKKTLAQLLYDHLILTIENTLVADKDALDKL